MARSFGQAFITDPVEVRAIADDIAGYDLPPGYGELFAMRFLGFELVAIGPANFAEQSLIMLMQVPPDARLSQAQMEAQVQQAVQQQMNFQNLQLEVVGERTATIRGDPVTLVVREGTDAGGRRMRQMSGLFQGRGGPTLLMIQAPQEEWNAAAVEAFLASIR
ncbi:MAG: hypothetical protein ACE5H9_11390 [Anaerolineae bacterium]